MIDSYPTTTRCVTRPRLLLHAARLVLAQAPILKDRRSAGEWADIEESWERLRKARDVTYSAQHHIKALAHLLAVMEASKAMPLAA